MLERLTTAARAAMTRALCPAAEDGQSTTEYTLVILVAATIALLLLNWAKGGAVTAFFDNIFGKVTGLFS
jgi:hypothetical protein